MPGLPQRAGFDADTRQTLCHWIARGATQAEAARRAGIPESSRLSAYFRSKRHAEDLHDFLAHRLRTDMAVKAARRLEEVLDDKDAPTRSVIDAAKTILDRAGHASRGVNLDPEDGRRPEEMSTDELVALIDRLEREKSDRAEPVNAAPAADCPPKLDDFLS